MKAGREQEHWTRVSVESRVFMEREGLRLLQQRLAQTRRFDRLSSAEVLDHVVRQVEFVREHCTCGAARNAAALDAPPPPARPRP